MSIPSEGIGSIPRPENLQYALASNNIDQIKELQVIAIRDTIEKLLDITNGEYPISDGEQSKPSFVTYPIAGL
eukprot:gene21422-27750_t